MRTTMIYTHVLNRGGKGVLLVEAVEGQRQDAAFAVGQDVVGHGCLLVVKVHGVGAANGPAGLVAVQPGIGGKPGQRAGDVEVVAVFVGPRADDRVVVGHGIALAHRDVLAALRATGDGWQTRINDMLRASLSLAGRLG